MQTATRLPFPARHRHRWLLACTFAALLHGCGGGSSTTGSQEPDPGPGPGSGGEPVTLVSSNPVHGASDVARDAQPELTFSSPVAPAAVRLSNALGPVGATFSADGPHLRVLPSARLLPLTAYRIQAGTDITVDFTTADGAWRALAEPVDARPGYAQTPDIAMDGGGRAIAVWRQQEGGVADTLLASHYVPGTGWATPLVLGNGDNPQVVMDAAGNALAAWIGPRDGALGAWFSRYTAGEGWQAAQPLDPGGNGSLENLRIAMNAQGDAVAAWQSGGGDFWGFNVTANRYVPGSGWQGPRLLEHIDEQAYEPNVAVAPDGGAVVVWEQAQGQHFHVYASRSTRGGDWDAAAAIDQPLHPSTRPRVAASGDGSFLAIWNQQETNDSVWSARWADGSWQAPERVNTGPEHVRTPTVALGAGGDAVVAWVVETLTERHVWVRRHVRGSGWDAPRRLDDGNGLTLWPQAVVDGSGNALVAWQQRDGVHATTTVARAPAGGDWGAATRLRTAAPIEAGPPRLVINASGTVMAAWDGYDGVSEARVFFNLFD